MDARATWQETHWRLPGLTPRNGVIVAALIAATMTLPPVIYGLLVWRRFGFISPSAYIPFEEVGQALAAGNVAGIMTAPVLSMNMTSGLLLSNMYSLSVGQLLVTLALGGVIALNIIAHLDLRQACSVTKAHGTAAAAGSGLFATVAAASTGIMGCCGSGVAGGVLALAGLSATSAASIAAWSMPVQALFIAGFVLNWIRLRRKLATARR